MIWRAEPCPEEGDVRKTASASATIIHRPSLLVRGMRVPCQSDAFGTERGRAMSERESTPREDGFEEAERDYATVANAIAAFEPVVMVCDPEQQSEVRRRCGEGVEVLPLPIDDSWMRDNGPIFVRDASGRIALVHFGFNSWGEKYLPYDRDAQVPRLIAEHLGMRRYEAPFVLEGGSFFVDGEGTLITTEQCLLNPNRNPTL